MMKKLSIRLLKTQLLKSSLLLGTCGLLLLLSGCGMIGKKDKPVRQAAITAPLKIATNAARSCGNEPSYQLNGKRYQVLSSAAGYQAEGVASWYGAEFQGSQTGRL